MFRSLKIAFILDNPHIIGGGDYAMFKYAEQLAGRGHDVCVYGQYKNAFMDQLALTSKFHLFLRNGCPPSLKGAGKINAMWDRLHTKCVVSPLLRGRQRPDVLIGYHKYSANKAVRLGRQLSLPVANVVFECPPWMLRMLGDRYRRVYTEDVQWEWEVVKESYRNSAALFPLAEVVRSEVSSWIGKPVAPPIYCGVNDPGPLSSGFAGGDFILYIGRLDVNKNVHEIIDAVSRLRRPMPLVIAGGGYEENDLKERVRQTGISCSFLGHVTDARKWELIRGCAFMVFPSSFEGFGIPPAEALVCGKPCICSDIPILKEVYGDVVESIPEHDIDAMVQTMEMLIARPDYRRERGAAGRTFILSRYTWAKCAERMEQGLLTLNS